MALKARRAKRFASSGSDLSRLRQQQHFFSSFDAEAENKVAMPNKNRFD